MQENLQPNSEKNLSLERRDALGDYAKTSDENKKEELKEKISNIDDYTYIAKPDSERLLEYKLGDISTPENVKKEKFKLDRKIEDIKESIEDTTKKLNDLREKLGMPPSEDIPSLMVKKERLESLREIQRDLESKLNFANKKAESVEQENVENSKIEKSGNQELMSSMGDDLKKISALLDSRVTRKETGVSALAMRAYESSDLEGIKHYISLVNHKVNEMQDGWSTNDNPETMQNLSRALSQLNENIKNIVSKVKDEEKRKEFSRTVSVVVNNIENTQNFFLRKAEALKQYQNLR